MFLAHLLSFLAAIAALYMAMSVGRSVSTSLKLLKIVFLTQKKFLTQNVSPQKKFSPQKRFLS